MTQQSRPRMGPVWLLLSLPALLAWGPRPANAEDIVLDRRITYQGQLQGVVPPVTLTFNLFTNLGENVWGPELHVVTPDTAGNFVTVLGATRLDLRSRDPNHATLPNELLVENGPDLIPDLDQLDDPDDLFLEVSVQSAGGEATALSPRQQIFPAFHAKSANTVRDRAITTAKLADGAVTSPKLLDGAVTSPKLADGTILSADLAPGAVTSTSISNGTIQAEDVAAGVIPPFIVGACNPAKPFIREIDPNGTVKCGQLLASVSYAVQRNNSGGSTPITMTLLSTSICFLKSVKFFDIEAASEFAECRVTRVGLNWRLDAVLGPTSDAKAHCSAHCIQW